MITIIFKEYGDIITRIGVNLYVLCVGSLFYSIVSMFIYRCAHTSQSPYFSYVSSMRNYFLSYFFFVGIAVFMIFIPGNKAMLMSNEIKSSMQDIDSRTYFYLNSGYTSVGLNVSFSSCFLKNGFKLYNF